MKSCASPVYFIFIVGRMSPKTSNRQQKYIHKSCNNISAQLSLHYYSG